MKRKAIYLLGFFLLFIAIEDPQGFIFPIGVFGYLFKDTISKFLLRFSLPTAFISTGLICGLMTELFAIWGNWTLPREEKILLHPDPLTDLAMGIFWYGAFVLIWYFLLRRYAYSKKTVFIISGIFGIVTEQSGAILVGIITSPIMGTLMALLIAAIYGTFPLLAYLFTHERFSEQRTRPKYYHYAFALCMLFLYWGIYGNFVHPIFLWLFPK